MVLRVWSEGDAHSSWRGCGREEELPTVKTVGWWRFDRLGV